MKYLILFVCCLSLLQCSDPAEEQSVLPPDDVLIDLLVDMHLAELPMSRVPQASRDSVGTIVRGMIARKYQISEDELEKVVAELQLNPEKFLTIYDSVAVRLDDMKNTGQ